MPSQTKPAEAENVQRTQVTPSQRESLSTARSFTTPDFNSGDVPAHQESRERPDPSRLADTKPYDHRDTKEAIESRVRERLTSPLSASQRDRERYSLQGVGSQFSGTADLRHQPGTERSAPAHTCPFHGPYLQERHMSSSRGQEVSPLDRYLCEGPSEQYAMYFREDTSGLSTYKGCSCAQASERNIDPNDVLKE